MNKNDIKNSMDFVKPDAYMKTRIKAKMSEVKPKKNRRRLAGIMSAAMCLIIMVSAFTLHSFPQRTDTADSTAPSQSSLFSRMPGSVIVAYADERGITEINLSEEMRNTDVKVSFPVGSRLYIQDYRGLNEEEKEAAYQEFLKTYNENLAILFSDNKTGSTMRHKDFDNYSYFFCNNGSFHVDLTEEEIENLESITVSNQNDFLGQSLTYNADKNDYIGFVGDPQTAHRTFADGDAYRELMADSQHLDKEDRGLFFRLEVYNSIENTVNETPDFDVTSITDEITFEVRFKSGEIATNVIGISFDEDGYMSVTPISYDFTGEIEEAPTEEETAVNNALEAPSEVSENNRDEVTNVEETANIGETTTSAASDDEPSPIGNDDEDDNALPPEDSQADTTAEKRE